jgi:hypothetical protein
MYLADSEVRADAEASRRHAELVRASELSNLVAKFYKLLSKNPTFRDSFLSDARVSNAFELNKIFWMLLSSEEEIKENPVKFVGKFLADKAASEILTAIVPGYAALELAASGINAVVPDLHQRYSEEILAGPFTDLINRSIAPDVSISALVDAAQRIGVMTSVMGDYRFSYGAAKIPLFAKKVLSWLIVEPLFMGFEGACHLTQVDYSFRNMQRFRDSAVARERALLDTVPDERNSFMLTTVLAGDSLAEDMSEAVAVADMFGRVCTALSSFWSTPLEAVAQQPRLSNFLDLEARISLEGVDLIMPSRDMHLLSRDFSRYRGDINTSALAQYSLARKPAAYDTVAPLILPPPPLGPKIPDWLGKFSIAGGPGWGAVTLKFGLGSSAFGVGLVFMAAIGLFSHQVRHLEKIRQAELEGMAAKTNGDIRHVEHFKAKLSELYDAYNAEDDLDKKTALYESVLSAVTAVEAAHERGIYENNKRLNSPKAHRFEPLCKPVIAYIDEDKVNLKEFVENFKTQHVELYVKAALDEYESQTKVPNYVAALAHVDSARAIHPQDAFLQEWHDELVLTIEKNKKINGYLAEAFAAIAIGAEGLDAALVATKEILALTENNLGILELQMSWLEEFDRKAAALIVAKQILVAAPEHIEANAFKGACEFSEQRFDLALKHFEQVLRQDPLHLFAVRGKALAQQQQGVALHDICVALKEIAETFSTVPVPKEADTEAVAHHLKQQQELQDILVYFKEQALAQGRALIATATKASIGELQLILVSNPLLGTREYNDLIELLKATYAQLWHGQPQKFLDEFGEGEFLLPEEVLTSRVWALFKLKRFSEIDCSLEALILRNPVRGAILKSQVCVYHQQLDKARAVLIKACSDHDDPDLRYELDKVQLKINLAVTNQVLALFKSVMLECAHGNAGFIALSMNRVVNLVQIVQRLDHDVLPHLLFYPFASATQQKMLGEELREFLLDGQAWLHRDSYNLNNLKKFENAGWLIADFGLEAIECRLDLTSPAKGTLANLLKYRSYIWKTLETFFGGPHDALFPRIIDVFMTPLSIVIDSSLGQLERTTSIEGYYSYQLTRDVLRVLPFGITRFVTAPTLGVPVVWTATQVALMVIRFLRGDYKEKMRNALWSRWSDEIKTDPLAVERRLRSLVSWLNDQGFKNDLQFITTLNATRKKNESGESVVVAAQFSADKIVPAEGQVSVVGMMAYPQYSAALLEGRVADSEVAYELETVTSAITQASAHRRLLGASAVSAAIEVYQFAADFDRQRAHQNCAYFYSCLARRLSLEAPVFRATFFMRVEAYIWDFCARVKRWFSPPAPAATGASQSVQALVNPGVSSLLPPRVDNDRWLLFMLIRLFMCEPTVAINKENAPEFFHMFFHLLFSKDRRIKLSTLLILRKLELDKIVFEWLGRKIPGMKLIQMQLAEEISLEFSRDNTNKDQFILSLATIFDKLATFFEDGSLSDLNVEEGQDTLLREYERIKEEFFISLKNGSVQAYRYRDLKYDNPDVAILDGLWGFYLALYEYKLDKTLLAKNPKALLDGALLRGFNPAFNFLIRRVLQKRKCPDATVKVLFYLMGQFDFDKRPGIDKLALLMQLSSGECELYKVKDSVNWNWHRRVICRLMRASTFAWVDATLELARIIASEVMPDIGKIKALLIRGADVQAVVPTMPEFAKKPLIYAIIELGWTDLFETLFQFGACFQVGVGAYRPSLEFILQQVYATRLLTRGSHVSFWVKVLTELRKYVLVTEALKAELKAYYFVEPLSEVLASGYYLQDNLPKHASESEKDVAMPLAIVFANLKLDSLETPEAAAENNT